VVIINITSNKRTLFNLNNKYLNYLGKISYGIYMYHFAVIAIVLSCSRALDVQLPAFTFNVLIYGTVIGLTVLISGLSYRFFEYRFIRLKSRFTGIVSGDQAHKID